MDSAVTGPVESGRVEPGTVEPGTVEPGTVEPGTVEPGRVKAGAVKAGAVKAGTVKCVVWDIDNTLLAGVYLESGAEPPPADPGMATVLRELAGRGILHAIASRNPPAAAEHAAQVTGCEFAAAECGWGRKSDAVARIAAELNVAAGALAFVDDDPYERAEVTFALPPVLVLSPEDMADAVGWPEFSPSVVTPEGRRRGGRSAGPGRSSCGPAARGSPSPRRRWRMCPGCTNCPSGPASSTRRAQTWPRMSSGR